MEVKESTVGYKLNNSINYNIISLKNRLVELSKDFESTTETLKRHYLEDEERHNELIKTKDNEIEKLKLAPGIVPFKELEKFPAAIGGFKFTYCAQVNITEDAIVSISSNKDPDEVEKMISAYEKDVLNIHSRNLILIDENKKAFDVLLDNMKKMGISLYETKHLKYFKKKTVDARFYAALKEQVHSFLTEEHYNIALNVIRNLRFELKKYIKNFEIIKNIVQNNSNNNNLQSTVNNNGDTKNDVDKMLIYYSAKLNLPISSTMDDILSKLLNADKFLKIYHWFNIESMFITDDLKYVKRGIENFTVKNSDDSSILSEYTTKSKQFLEEGESFDIFKPLIECIKNKGNAHLFKIYEDFNRDVLKKFDQGVIAAL